MTQTYRNPEDGPGLIFRLIHTVTTEPDEIRAAVVAALDEALALIDRHGDKADLVIGRLRNAIEDGADA